MPVTTGEGRMPGVAELEETPMKHLARVIGIAVLFSLLGTIAPAYAQEEHHDEQAKPEQRTQQKQKAQQKQDSKQAQRAQKMQQKQGAQQAKSAHHAQQQQQRAQQARPAQQTQRASNNGGRIPDARFRAHFGRDHAFRINRPVMVSGAPRFQYGGYWFGFGEPWPVGWNYTDQVYVDFINGGYYLLSPVHPGVQISINVIL